TVGRMDTFMGLPSDGYLSIGIFLFELLLRHGKINLVIRISYYQKELKIQLATKVNFEFDLFTIRFF
ncbi:MAG TPA: hypothetical protein DCY95_06920, partial [Algoriphagus sp.]|nr:hypothetical protein [Algoriphagus sp.]